MKYFVVMPDGQEFGPADMDTLTTWKNEGRINPTTTLKSVDNGAILPASQLTQLFPASVAPAAAAPMQTPSHSMHTPPMTTHNANPGKNLTEDSPMVLLGVLWRPIAAVVLFFVLHGVGIAFAGYGMYYAIQLKQSGSKYGTFAIIFAAVALVAVGVGWLMRLTGAPG
ncbi:MAG: hypothetical protein KDC26_05480 [Armatimonadetes bacterium]|nr:hypothetical protein [Armatimonadota bacterium]